MVPSMRVVFGRPNSSSAACGVRQCQPTRVRIRGEHALELVVSVRGQARVRTASRVGLDIVV